MVFGLYLTAVLSLVGFPNIMSLKVELTVNIIPFVYMIDDFVNAWGTSEDNWKTAEAEDVVSENGYLWLVDNDKTTAIIVYVSNEEEFQSIAISKDVIKDNYGTFIVK